VSKERNVTQAAAIQLTGTILGVLTTTVDGQIEKSNSDRTRATIFFVLALLFLLAAFLVGQLGRRRRAARRSAIQDQVAPSSPAQAPRVPVGFGESAGQAPRREWSGAPR
jgi:hypothetical protein